MIILNLNIVDVVLIFQFSCWNGFFWVHLVASKFSLKRIALLSIGSLIPFVGFVILFRWLTIFNRYDLKDY